MDQEELESGYRELDGFQMMKAPGDNEKMNRLVRFLGRQGYRVVRIAGTSDLIRVMRAPEPVAPKIREYKGFRYSVLCTSFANDFPFVVRFHARDTDDAVGRSPKGLEFETKKIAIRWAKMTIRNGITSAINGIIVQREDGM